MKYGVWHFVYHNPKRQVKIFSFSLDVWSSLCIFGKK